VGSPTGRELANLREIDLWIVRGCPPGDDKLA
jgi:hypothetical protein